MPSIRARSALLASSMILAGACSPARHYNSDLGPISGSTGRLQPRIASAATTSREQVITFALPERSYVSVVEVLTQSSVSVLGTSPVGAPTGLQPMDAGEHKIFLTAAPVRIASNVRRTARPLNEGDPRLEPTDTRYHRNRYALVVATAVPLTLADLQQSLEQLDLTGPDDAVLQRVAEAIGAHSLGAWAASAARVAQQSSVF